MEQNNFNQYFYLIYHCRWIKILLTLFSSVFYHVIIINSQLIKLHYNLKGYTVNIIEYFSTDNKEYWISKINESDWVQVSFCMIY